MLPRRPSSDPGVALGLATVALGAVFYWSLREQAGQPLAVLVLGPLLTAAMSSPRRTAGVAAAATITALVLGLADSLSSAPLLTRLGIVVVGSWFGIAAATARSHQQERYESARLRLAMSDSLQIGLVPVPHPPSNLAVEARYQPGERGLLLGGDFFDVITLDDGSSAFVIGDVSGHGARAAAFGTAVRAGWKSVAHSRPGDLATWLDDVEAAFFGDDRFDGFVTALTGRIDAADGRVEVVSAGHPWPVLIDERDGRARLATVVVGPPLGVRTPVRRCVTRLAVEPWESIVLYTDGIMENAWSPGGRAGEDGLLREVTALAGSFSPDALIQRLGPDGYQDDVAVLWLRRLG